MPTSTPTTARDVPRMEVEKLVLDKNNPRLASLDVGSGSLEDLVLVLWREQAVDELVLSIAHNGFYDDEPLLVIPERKPDDTETGRYIVLEGNRRLAAVLLLRDKALRERVRATELPEISDEDRRKLDTIPYSLHTDRESLWAYLGFRHVNGTKAWDALSKAQYVAYVHETFGESVDDIALRIGDVHATVRRLFRGYLALRQAEEWTAFEVRDRIKNRFHFSHLYTAVAYPEVQDFLGITEKRWATPSPVPKAHLGDLGDLMKWIYGSQAEGVQPVIRTQHPDLGYLRRILGSQPAVALLRSGYPLASALDESIGDKRRFREAIFAAKQELQKAKATVTTGYTDDEEVLETVEGLVATLETIRDEMAKKRTAAAEKKP